jgi:hypothetical protein
MGLDGASSVAGSRNAIRRSGDLHAAIEGLRRGLTVIAPELDVPEVRTLVDEQMHAWGACQSRQRNVAARVIRAARRRLALLGIVAPWPVRRLALNPRLAFLAMLANIEEEVP